jgi:hypothetical protein
VTAQTPGSAPGPAQTLAVSLYALADELDPDEGPAPRRSARVIAMKIRAAAREALTVPAPGHMMVMRGTIALRDAEIEMLRARVAELAEALGEAAGHVEPVDQNSELAVGRWLELAKRYCPPQPGADG